MLTAHRETFYNSDWRPMNETSARHTFAMLGQTTADLFAALQIKRGRMIDGILSTVKPSPNTVTIATNHL